MAALAAAGGGLHLAQQGVHLVAVEAAAGAHRTVTGDACTHRLQSIGEGRGAAELIAHRKTVVEGYNTTESFAGLCAEKKIDAPILREVHAILFAGKKPAAALAALMTRELKRESLAPLAGV